MLAFGIITIQYTEYYLIICIANTLILLHARPERGVRQAGGRGGKGAAEVGLITYQYLTYCCTFHLSGDRPPSSNVHQAASTRVDNLLLRHPLTWQAYAAQGTTGQGQFIC